VVAGGRNYRHQRPVDAARGNVTRSSGFAGSTGGGGDHREACEMVADSAFAFLTNQEGRVVAG
jgi:hypothetical protein